MKKGRGVYHALALTAVVIRGTLVASLFCFTIGNTAVKNLGTVHTSHSIYFVPLVTPISSALILHETITPVALAGAALTLGGVYVAENGPSVAMRKKLKPTHP